MQQSIATRQDVDERTELGGRHNLAHVHRTDFSLRRIKNQLDTATGFANSGTVRGTDRHDADPAVVVNGDVGAGLLLHRIDDLALRSDHLTDLVHRDLEADDLRCSLVDFRPRRGNGCVHDIENLQPGFFRLLKRRTEHIGGNPVDLGVELQRGDELTRARNFEVHVAESVFRSENIGKRCVLTFGKDQTHRDTGHGRLDRNTCVHQRHRCRADGTHRCGAVRRKDFADQSDGVGKLFLAWDNGKKRSLGQLAMSDLATLRRTDTPRFAIGRRRHVVVVHEVLLVNRLKRVEHLVHLRHSKCAYVHHLRFTSLEQAGAVGGRNDADFCADGAKIAWASTIDALTGFDDTLANNLLLKAAGSFFDFLLASGELTGVFRGSDEGGHDLTGRSRKGGFPLGLDHDLRGRLHCLGADLLHGGEDIVAVIENRDVRQRRSATGRLDQLLLQGDRFFDPCLRCFEAIGDDFLGHLWRALFVVLPRLLGATGLHHHDGDVTVVELTARNHEFEGGLCALFEGGMGNPVTLGRIRNAYCTNWTVERDARDHECCGRSVDRQDVVGVLLIGSDYGGHDLGLVAIAVGERRTQRSVGQTTRKNRRIGGAAFTTEE